MSAFTAAHAVATVTECEACFTPDACQLRGTCDHYSAEQLRIAAALYAPPPLTDEQMRHIAEQYQRDAIASAQSTMPDDGAGEEA